MQSRESYIKSLIRRRYAKLASQAGGGGRERALRAGYCRRTLDRLPPAVVAAWSGCGDVMGDRVSADASIVVDLGAGSGVDALIAASAGERPKLVIAVDLAPETLRWVARARDSVLPVGGDYERLPFGDAVCDVVISNAAFNLALDRDTAFSEALRILRPGGLLHICDLVRDDELPSELLSDPMSWSTSLGGVPLERELVTAISGAGFADVTVHGHRAFPPVISVRVDAVKPPAGNDASIDQPI